MLAAAAKGFDRLVIGPPVPVDLRNAEATAETVAAPDTSQVHGRVGEAPASAGNVVAHHPCKARESIPYAGDGLCGATLDCTDA